MRSQHDNDIPRMDESTIQRRPLFASPISLRTLQAESVQLNTSRLPPVIPHRKADGTIRFTDTSVPPYSPISERSGSSFSQDSITDSWENISNKSPPQTPKPKYESDDAPRLDLVPPRGDFLKRKCDDLDESLKKIKLPRVTLPGVNHILSSEERGTRLPSSQNRPRRILQTPSSSPEPENEYSLSSQPAFPPTEDPIVKYLNLRRRESSNRQELLSQPRNSRGFLNIHLSFYDQQPVFCREKQQYAPQSRGYCQQPLPQPSTAIEEDPKDGCNKKNPHNNVKYRIEEGDFIRFNKYEMKLSWQENKIRFNEKFPMPPGKQREVQGIQGVHYRDNQHLPHLVDKGRRLVFRPDGHIEAVTVKVRKQRENKPYFSLTYLYPERAMLYDWVPYKLQLAAAELAKERAAQKELAKRKAVESGEYQEKLPNGLCACCYKPDGEEPQKRASLRDSSLDEGEFSMPDRLAGSPLKISHIVKAEDGPYTNPGFEASHR
ncbi:hypothetical protein F5Y11DRAFT_350582 [Daldinia sp. FL1419]|nr:hypothetical protein F5Y11DRAFT_350582 [Daldinia sp. FL1419]